MISCTPLCASRRTDVKAVRAANDGIPLSASAATHQLQSHLALERGSALKRLMIAILILGGVITNMSVNEKYIKYTCYQNNVLKIKDKIIPVFN
jgi:hypothetical protein